MDRYLVVLAGAGIGGVARYAVGAWVIARYGGRVPLATMAINVSGSFLIGLLMAMFTARWVPHPNWRLFLVTGVLGGFTTFSSFEYETLQAVREEPGWMAAMYVTGSVGFGYLAVWLGWLLAQKR